MASDGSNVVPARWDDGKPPLCGALPDEAEGTGAVAKRAGGSSGEKTLTPANIASATEPTAAAARMLAPNAYLSAGSIDTSSVLPTR
jgi:hypothetical protein